jgi:hypothetical protein
MLSVCPGAVSAPVGAGRHDSGCPGSVRCCAVRMSAPVRPGGPRSGPRGDGCSGSGDRSSGVAHRPVASVRPSACSPYDAAHLKDSVSHSSSDAHRRAPHARRLLAPGAFSLLHTSKWPA